MTCAGQGTKCLYEGCQSELQEKKSSEIQNLLRKQCYLCGDKFRNITRDYSVFLCHADHMFCGYCANLEIDQKNFVYQSEHRPGSVWKLKRGVYDGRRVINNKKQGFTIRAGDKLVWWCVKTRREESAIIERIGQFEIDAWNDLDEPDEVMTVYPSHREKLEWNTLVSKKKNAGDDCQFRLSRCKLIPSAVECNAPARIRKMEKLMDKDAEETAKFGKGLTLTKKQCEDYHKQIMEYYESQQTSVSLDCVINDSFELL